MRSLFLVLLAACGSSPVPEAPTAVEAPQAPGATTAQAGETDAQALERAKGAAQHLGKTLKGRLVGKMSEGGPPAALEVCTADASALTQQVSDTQGVHVGRSTLRLRNPANVGPDWVQAWLTNAGERPAAGLAPVTEVVDTPNGRVAHFLKPLPVEAPCLACHGPAESLAPEISALLAKSYPDDKATGYALGDLRGVLWAETPVKTTP